MAERAKYEKWLTELEAKRGSTPAKAFEKVHKDYSTRLERVLEKLRAHQTTLEQHASELAEKLERLAEAEEDAAESLAEAELRAQVGELTQSEWDAVSKKAEKELSKIKQDKTVTESDLERIRALMAGATPGGGTAVVEQETASTEPEPGALAEPVAESDSAPSEMESSSGPNEGEHPGRPAGMDELEFLKSVVGSTPPGSSAPPAGKSAGAPIQPPARPKPATPKSQPVQPPAAARPAEPLVEKQEDSAPLIGKAAETPLSQNVPDSTIELKARKDSIAQDKTLKCGECGTLNYPSEWYCERCGAELTNV